MEASRPTVDKLAADLRAPDPGTQEHAARELGRSDNPRATMLLYDFVRDDTAHPGPRAVAAEALVRIGLLRRERSGPSTMFMWMAGMATVIVIVGSVSTVGPVAAAVLAAGAVALGLYALRRRAHREEEPVYIGPHGERLDITPRPAAPRAGPG